MAAPKIAVNVTTGSYTIGLSGQVDDVKFYPADTQMTTYTNDPLIGITSMTDPNNVTIYYEYDDFGRLKLFKDAEGNVLKTFSYHYEK